MIYANDRMKQGCWDAESGQMKQSEDLSRRFGRKAAI
jgi:hypothetical protein